ncbi:RT0821/Lpp0805 family surface protein [Rhizobium sp. LjRoot30]
MTDIAKSNIHTKGLCARFGVAAVLAAAALGLSGCVGNGMDLFGSKVDQSISTSTIADGKNKDVISDEVTVRNAVTSADMSKLEGKPLAWANASTGSAGVISAISEQTQDGTVCRAFETSRHSYVGVANFQGKACLAGDGNWQLLSFQENK